MVFKNKSKKTDYLEPSSMITLPVETLACDIEVIEDAKGGYRPIEISFFNVKENKIIFHSHLNPGNDLIIPDYKIEKFGFCVEKIRNGMSLEELDNILKIILKNAVCVCWNIKHELKLLGQLEEYSLATRCCMERFSNRYGAYKNSFGNHSYVSLKEAARIAEIELMEGEYFHRSSTDARIAGEIWNFLNRENVPGNELKGDLILRSEHLEMSEQYEKKLLEQSQEISNLKLKLDSKETFDAEDIPF